MLLNDPLTQVHSQKEPRLHFGESFTLSLLFFAPKCKLFVSVGNVYCMFIHSLNVKDVKLSLLFVFRRTISLFLHETLKAPPKRNTQTNLV